MGKLFTLKKSMAFYKAILDINKLSFPTFTKSLKPLYYVVKLFQFNDCGALNIAILK